MNLSEQSGTPLKTLLGTLGTTDRGTEKGEAMNQSPERHSRTRIRRKLASLPSMRTRSPLSLLQAHRFVCAITFVGLRSGLILLCGDWHAVWPTLDDKKIAELTVLCRDDPSPSDSVLEVWSSTLDANKDHVKNWIQITSLQRTSQAVSGSVASFCL